MSKKKRYFVKPYIPNGYRFLGLERYNMVLFDHCKQKEYLGYVEVNGIKRYLTGLDEFAPSITSITNDKIREEKIKEIRKEVADIEMKLIYNKLDINDVDFWTKVNLLQATNTSFWSKVFIELDNNGFELNVHTNPNHKILYHCIKAGGFDIIAPSYKIAAANSTKYYFYLETPDEKDINETTEKKLKNKAIGILSSLEENNKKQKLLYLVKILHKNGLEYSLDNSIFDLYSALDEYITEYNKIIDNSERFIKYASFTEKELFIYSILSDMQKLKKLYYKELDRQYYCVYTNTFLGQTLEECVSYLLMSNNKIILYEILNKYKEDLVLMGINVDFVIDDYNSQENEVVGVDKEEKVISKKRIKNKDMNDNEELDDFLNT